MNILNQAKFAFYSIFILMFLWVLIVLGQAYQPTRNSEWYYDLVTIKHDIAKKKASPKVLFLGGSSVLFGLNAEHFEKISGIQAINYGLGAALDLELILKSGLRDINKGDIVVLPLEYELYDYKPNFPNEELLDYVFSRDLMHLSAVGPKTLLTYFFTIEMKRVQIGYAQMFTGNSPRNTNTGYDSRTVSTYGDETNNLEAHRKIPKDKPYYRPIRILIDGIDDHSEGWNVIEEFLDRVKSKGAIAVGAFPNSIFYEDYQTHLKLEEQIQRFYKKKGVTVIGTAKEYMYPQSEFFDTVYHLSRNRMILRTEQTYRDLRKNNIIL